LRVQVNDRQSMLPVTFWLHFVPTPKQLGIGADKETPKGASELAQATREQTDPIRLLVFTIDFLRSTSFIGTARDRKCPRSSKARSWLGGVFGSECLLRVANQCNFY
jgi:hypothetical protein